MTDTSLGLVTEAVYEYRQEVGARVPSGWFSGTERSTLRSFFGLAIARRRRFIRSSSPDRGWGHEFNFSPLSSLKRRKHPLGVKTKSFPPTSPASRWLFNPSSVSLLSKGQYFPCHLVSGAMVNDTRRVTSTFVPEDRFYVDRRSGLNETFRRFIAAWPRIETRIPRAIEK